MRKTRKVILYSKSGYTGEHDTLLERLIDEKILLFCAVGKDCELWEEIMDELFVGEGDERDFFMITTSHSGEDLNEVVEFAERFEIQGIDNEKAEVIQI